MPLNKRNQTKLSIIRYVSRVKWSNPGSGEAPFPTPTCNRYWKGSLRVALDYGRQLYLVRSTSQVVYFSKERTQLFLFFSVVFCLFIALHNRKGRTYFLIFHILECFNFFSSMSFFCPCFMSYWLEMIFFLCVYQWFQEVFQAGSLNVLFTFKSFV